MRNIDLQIKFNDMIGEMVGDEIRPFTTTEIERYLNTAMDARVQALADRFEVNEKARRELDKLTQGVDLLPIGQTQVPSINDNSVFFSQPDDLLRIVEEQVVVGTDKIKVKPVTHDQYNANIDNPFRQPYEDLYWRLDADDYIEIVPPENTGITSYNIRYIKEPERIDIMNYPDRELELQDDTLNEIVMTAVELALKSFSIGRSKGN